MYVCMHGMCVYVAMYVYYYFVSPVLERFTIDIGRILSVMT